MNLIGANMANLRWAEDRMEVMSMISPIKLIEGGAAILQADNRNHHIAMEGNNIRIPFVVYILRELIVSYVMFARLNIHEEHSP